MKRIDYSPRQGSIQLNEIKGKCLCGAVKYKFAAKKLIAYQCHCSICRKSTGSAFSSTLIAEDNHFVWLCGESVITSYSKESGYKVQFCSKCGSPVPNKFRGYPLYSIPLGSLESEHKVDIAVQLHLDSKAVWNDACLDAHKYSKMPKVEEILNVLHV